MLNDVVRDVVADFDEEKRPSTEAVEKLQKDIDSLNENTIKLVESLSLGDQYALICYCFKHPDRICYNVDFCIRAILDRKYQEGYQYRWKPNWLKQCDKDWKFIYDSLDFVGDAGEVEERKARCEAIKNAEAELDTTKYIYESRETIEPWYKRLIQEMNKFIK